MAIFIVFGFYAIQCISQNCNRVPYYPIEMMIGAGTLELIFELGVVRIFRNSRRKDDDNDTKG